MIPVLDTTKLSGAVESAPKRQRAKSYDPALLSIYFDITRGYAYFGTLYS